MSWQLIGCFAVAAFIASSFSSAARAAEHWVLLGTGGGDAKGIYIAKFNAESGELSDAALAIETDRPGFLAVHPNQKFVYAICSIDDPENEGKKIGGVRAYAFDRKAGKLTLINEQSSQGSGPCHLSVDKDGRCVLVANYSGGNVSILPIKEDGSLDVATMVIQHEGSSVNPQRQKQPHAHSFTPDLQGRYALAADLGTDEVLIYALNAAEATLEPHGAAILPPGSGPRHLAFHPNGRWVYVINELLSTITAMEYDAEEGTLTPRETVPTLPDDYEQRDSNTTAEVVVHPSGKFVYGSNRGHDSIAVYQVNQEDGTLEFVEREPVQGKTPRNFNVDPSGKWLLAAGQNSGSVALFKIDSESGELTYADRKIDVPTPICVKFVPVE